jgi:hypothetical protein
MLLWIAFWLAFAIAAAVWISKNGNTFFATSSHVLLRNVLRVCLVVAAATFVINWLAIHNGQVPNGIAVWLFQNALWALPIIAIALVVQTIGINQRANARR